MQRSDLVVHQRNQRRHNNRHAVARVLPRNRRDLVAQRLAAARGHQHQCIAAIHHMVNDGGLRATKVGVTKDLAQDVERRRLMGNLMVGCSQFGFIYMLLIQELLAPVLIGLEANLIGKKLFLDVFRHDWR